MKMLFSNYYIYVLVGFIKNGGNQLTGLWLKISERATLDFRIGFVNIVIRSLPILYMTYRKAYTLFLTHLRHPLKDQLK